jgi:hypothetical protein
MTSEEVDMLGMRRREPIAMAGLVIALAASSASANAATARADTGQPQGGGGCHMVSSLVGIQNFTGLDHMMAGSANGNGAANMQKMLALFSPDPFCGY